MTTRIFPGAPVRRIAPPAPHGKPPAPRIFPGAPMQRVAPPHHRQPARIFPGAPMRRITHARTKKRGWSAGVPQCCAAQALAMSLRLAGGTVSDEDVLDLYWATATSADEGQSVSDAFSAAQAWLSRQRWFVKDLCASVEYDAVMISAIPRLLRICDVSGSEVSQSGTNFNPEESSVAEGDQVTAAGRAERPEYVVAATEQVNSGCEFADRSDGRPWQNGKPGGLEGLPVVLRLAVPGAIALPADVSGVRDECPAAIRTGTCQAGHGRGHLSVDGPAEPARSAGSIISDSDATDAYFSTSDAYGLILGLDLPEGPHAVFDDGRSWWSWGEPYNPADFAGAVVEEAWAVTWA